MNILPPVDKPLILAWVFLCFSLTLQAQSRCPDLIAATWAVIALEDCEDACLPVPYGDLAGYGIQLNGAPLDQAALPCDFDSSFVISYGNLPGGGQAGPYTVVNWTVNGVNFSGSFDNLSDLIGLLNTWDPSGQWKLSPSAMLITGGNPSNVYGPLQIQQNSSGIISLLSANVTLVPKGTQVVLSPGIHTLIFEQLSTGCLDTLMVAAGCPQSFASDWVIPLGGADTLCFTPTALAGTADTLINICPEEGGELAVLSLYSDSCMIALGVETGEEAACILVCDAYGLCDTVFLNIAVIDFSQAAPRAVDDSLSLADLVPAQVNVLDNDHLQGDVWSVVVVQGPQSGTAVLTPEGLLTYTPPEFDCTVPFQEMLTYEVCTAYGCDQARVHIRGICAGPRVYNGFSPNGDGVNDYFRIEGLDRYGGHELWVFNRWSEVVYYSSAYHNDWDGTWKNRPLPEGTYFYLLEYGQGQRSAGFLQLER